MESWDNYLGEAGLKGINRQKIAQLLNKLGRKVPKDDEEGKDLPGGDDVDDALPADGTDDDSLEGTDDDFDVDVADQQDQVQAAHAVNFLNHYLNYDKFRVNIVKMARDNLKRALNKAVKDQRGAEPGPDLSQLPEQNSFDEGQREAIYRKVSNAVLNRVEAAIKQALPKNTKDLVYSDVKESLNKHLFPVLVEVCRQEDKKLLNESKRKFVIKIGK